MYIWIDESYDSKFPGYIVIGALISHADNKEPIDQCFSTLMKRIKTHNNNCKKAQKISCPEIHENVLYGKGKHYRQIKHWAFDILKEHSTSSDLEIKAVYTAIPLDERELMSEERYFAMVSDLVSHCISLCAITSNKTYIIMDKIFDNRRMSSLLQKFKDIFPSSVYQFSFAESTAEKGLQFADLIVGTIRRHLNLDVNNARAYEQLEAYFSPILLQTK